MTASPTRLPDRQGGDGVALLVNIDVDDLATAERFYCTAFGLAAGRRFGTDVLELTGAQVPLYLLRKPAGSPSRPEAKQVRNYGRHWTPVHLDIVVPDVEVALARAQAAGAVPEGPIGTHDWGRIVALADPFGHGICLVQFLGRGYDAIADRPAGA